MRTLFLLLVLANAGLAAYLYWLHTEGRAASPVIAQQIAPERIRLISAEEAASLAAGRRPSGATACLEWGAFAPAEVAKAAESLDALGVKARERRQEEGARWWVVLPPLASRNAAAVRLSELRKQGVEDLFVIDEDNGGLRNGISLGVFRSEEGARARLDALARRGVNGARIVSRDAVVRMYLQVRDAPEGLRARAADLKAAWPAAELRDCPAEGRN